MSEVCWGKYPHKLFHNLVNIIECYLEDDETDVETFVKKYLKEVKE